MAETVKKRKAAAKPRKTAAKKTTAAKSEPLQMPHKGPSHEQVAALARKYWAERGYQEGRQEEDWFRAEQELRAKAS